MNVGSKSVYAYTDSFTVQTVFDGIKYRYLCYIDETQLGAISLLTKEETVLENQTEIIISVKDERKDFQLFQAAITNQLSYFKTIKYKGFEAPDPEIQFENEYCILKKLPELNDLHLVLGDVVYKIPYNALDMDQYKWRSEGLSTCAIGLKFAIGELQPTMSRESLFWDDATKAKVLARLTQASQSIRTLIEKELSKEIDYAKWYGMVQSLGSTTFPDQWVFAKVSSTVVRLSDRKKLPICADTQWFAGHNARKVTVPDGYRRRKKTSAPDYDTSSPTGTDFRDLPVYRVDKNLSGIICKFLFQKHPSGFLAINHIGVEKTMEDLKITKAELNPYYKATKGWLQGMPCFDDVVVPANIVSNGEARDAAYKELQRRRKFEGKFTAKALGIDYKWRSKLEDQFVYNLYENKFQDVKDYTIIYCSQEDHPKMATLAAMLTYDKVFYKKFIDKDKVLFLKIAQNYEKQFEVLPNSYCVNDVLALKTPLTSNLASIATALRIKPTINTYHILWNFIGINAGMATLYQKLWWFVEAKTFVRKVKCARTYHTPELNKLILDLCKDIRDEKHSKIWETILGYFNGAELLKCINFIMTEPDYDRKYLKELVDQNKDSITDYLIMKGKEVDGYNTVNIQSCLETIPENEMQEELVTI